MRRLPEPAIEIHRRTTVLVLAMFVFALPALAQIPSESVQAERTRANQLPLSGRAGQVGSVEAIESPIPGTTNSVNTINPSIQVQGNYAGSARGTPDSIVTGKLSLREAVQRGIQYNLGAVSQAQAVRQARGQSQTARS